MMAKFNRKREREDCLNYELAPAYSLDDSLALYNLVVNSFVEDKFYERSVQERERLRRLVARVDPHFTCRLAIYARKEMYLRTIPLVLMVELFKAHQSRVNFDRRPFGRAVTAVIERADEISEILSYYQLSNGRKGTKKLNRLARQLQNGVARAFNKFDEYQFAKYNRKGEVTLKDALFLTHPKASGKKQQALFDKIATDTLETPYTWEVELSTKGNSAKTWKELIDSGKIGYMALLRNLRNILNSGVGRRELTKVADFISNKKRVLKSKQLPMRFYSAYRELESISGSAIFIEALEEAVRHSVENIELFRQGRFLLASDVSGSMMQPLSARSKLQCYDVGLMLSMLLRYRLENRVTTGIFGDCWKVKNMPAANILANVDVMRRVANEVGYSTNGHLVIEWALKEKLKFEKILFFTDCQIYDSAQSKVNSLKRKWTQYKKFYPEAKLYLFNLAGGYNTTPLLVDEQDVFMISGFSDRIFEMVEAVEKGASVIKKINEVEL